MLIAGIATRRPLVSWWGVATVALALGFFWTWAVLTDHDNLEYGPRLERLILPALLVLAASGYAAWRTIRQRRAGQLNGESSRAAV
jgi:hypothetical protein